MKKIFSLLTIAMLVSMSFVMAVPVGQINLIGDPQTNPIYSATNFEPLVFLNANGGRVLYDDPYGIWENGNIESRTQNYAFTGEQIEWKVLVWEKNGLPEKIDDVFAGWVTQTNGPLDPNAQVNCEYLGKDSTGGNLEQMGYSHVRRPGDQEDQTDYNEETMGEYSCVLTIEPTCHGQKWLGVKAVDLEGASGTMQEAESWFCNPTMEISVSGSIDFGELGPGERGSSTISVQNNAEVDSGMEVVFYISGTDFYDPSSSGAMCPISNQLSLSQFSYSAVQGSKQILDQTIPYGTSVTTAKKILPGTTPTNPGTELSLTLSLDIPQPCNGAFTDGDIFLWAVAV